MVGLKKQNKKTTTYAKISPKSGEPQGTQQEKKKKKKPPCSDVFKSLVWLDVETAPWEKRGSNAGPPLSRWTHYHQAKEAVKQKEEKEKIKKKNSADYHIYLRYALRQLNRHYFNFCYY